jgi:hypothetical protein
MQIANPTYDVVFKYLMSDKKIARLIISSIIEEEVVSLDLKPQVHKISIQGPVQSWTVVRFDFAAQIKTPDGLKQIIIEMQKAKLPTDIMRFRRYLGQQYQDDNNTYIEDVNGVDRKHAIPIVSIYFLGHALAHAENIPLIKVKRKYYDAATGQEITQQEEFIESLTHDSYVVQLPYLHQQRRTKAERFLSVFDQDNIGESKHILNIDEKDFPEECKSVIRCLRKAVEKEEVRNSMIGEDDYIEAFQMLERALASKDKVLQENAKVLQENAKVLQEKDEALQEQRRMIEQLQRQLEGK